MTQTLECKSVSKGVGRGRERSQILDRFDYVFPSSAITVVTGPSGAGKSTLLSLIGALARPDEGEVVLPGHRITASTTRKHLIAIRRTQIGFLFQSSGLINALTAEHNVRLPLSYSREPDSAVHSRVHCALERYGLAQRAQARVAALSGGERHRLALARIYAQRAPWLICDEPTTGLDPDWVEQVISDLKGHAADGVGVIIASHDSRVVAAADQRLHLTTPQPDGARV